MQKRLAGNWCAWSRLCLAALLIIGAGACSAPATTSLPSPVSLQPSETTASLPAPSQPLLPDYPTEDASPPATFVQPPQEAIYYQTENDPTGQVWRLAPDHVTRTQVTFEPEAVTAFAPSPTGAWLALSSQRSLALVQIGDVPAGGIPGERQAIVDGAERSPGTPVWAPDGGSLAYYARGVQIYNLRDGQVSQLLIDSAPPKGNLQGIEFRPLAWSPQGDRLLVEATQPWGAIQLVIVGLADGIFTELQAIAGESAPACCQTAWSRDGGSLWVANATPAGGFPTGLWNYDPKTGEGTAALPPDGVDKTSMANYAAWPYALESGDVLFLYAQAEINFQGILPLIPVRLNLADNSRIEVLFNNNLAVKEFLWHPDGKWGVAVLAPPGAPGGMRGGPAVLIPFDGSSPTPLLESAFHLRWGP